ncbi:hypothetical protein ATCC90586_011693 [Pythium insidiosum]|nr:hypothetical protein ATCC90586_011693 [Pythium insidiosum]
MARPWLSWRLHTLLSMLRVRRSHRARLQWVLFLLALARAWRFLVRRWLQPLHLRNAAEAPRLFYKPTPTNDALLARCPTLTTTKYCPPWHGVSGHLQTIRLAQEMDTAHPIVRYERQILDMPDGGIVSLDWALPPRQDGTIPRVSELDPTRRTLLLLPGFTGGSDEFYIRCVVHRLVALGWQCGVLNARGCANTPLKTAQFFCIAYTDDVRYVLRTLRQRYALGEHDAFVVAGFSLGANVLVKFLGEERDAARGLVTAAVSVGNPFDVAECSRALSTSPLHRVTYYAALARNLKELIFQKSNAAELLARHPKLDLDAIRRASDLYELDDKLTRVLFGYDSVDAFYEDASSASRLPHVRVPLLCLNAEDDPISVKTAIPYAAPQENPHVLLCTTKHGGHLAYYEHAEEEDQQHGDGGDPSGRIWSVKAIAEFVESVRKERELLAHAEAF